MNAVAAMRFFLLPPSVRGEGMIITISRSNIRNSRVMVINWLEKLFFLDSFLNPHSKGDLFVLLNFCFFMDRIITVDNSILRDIDVVASFSVDIE